MGQEFSPQVLCPGRGCYFEEPSGLWLEKAERSSVILSLPLPFWFSARSTNRKQKTVKVIVILSRSA